MEKKFACLLYRTKTTEQENQAEMERQRALACNLPRNRAGPQSESSGVQKKTAVRWMRIRFWNCEPVQKAKFQILLVSEFDRIGRVPLECSAAAAFF